LFIVLFFAILYFAKPFLIPIAIGGMMAMLLVPACRRLEYWGLRRGLAGGICVFITLVVLSGLFYVLFYQMMALGTDIPAIASKLNAMLNNAHNFISEHFQLPIEKQKDYLQSQVAGLSDLAGKFIGDIFRSVLSFLVHLLIVTAYTLLLLIYRGRIKTFILRLVTQYTGKENMENARDVIGKITKVASAYLTGVFSVALIFSVINSIGLM